MSDDYARQARLLEQASRETAEALDRGQFAEARTVGLHTTPTADATANAAGAADSADARAAEAVADQQLRSAQMDLGARDLPQTPEDERALAEGRASGDLGRAAAYRSQARTFRP